MAERILIVKLGAMGDVLRTTTCLEPLKQRYPASHITWITRENAIPLLDGNPWIDRILSVDGNYLELVLAERFDLAIGPDTDAVSASIMSLVRADIKQGFTADGRGGVTPLSETARDWWLMGIDDGRKRENRRTYGEWLYAMCNLPVPIARPRFDLSQSVTESVARRLRDSRPQAQRWIGFNTGAGNRWAEKQWKLGYYVRLAEMIEAKDPGCAVLLVGGPEQHELNRQLLLTHPGFVDGGTDNSVAEFAALIAACDWLVTADSLGYHLACAMETAAICLVGPTSPWELDAYGVNCVLYPPLDCIACYRARCPFETTCMDVLSPDVVWSRMLVWMSGSNPERKSPTLVEGGAASPRPHRLPLLGGVIGERI